MKRLFSVILGALLLAGCTSTPTVTPVADPVSTWTSKTGIVRRAVIAGLTNVDPNAYDGWDGACPGCDTDSSIMAMLAKEQNLETQLFQNKQATSVNLINAVLTAWQDMKSGDLLMIFISGHGGQIQDANGDEEDGQDETICLWDGQLNDDKLYDLWQKCPAGVRVLFITDNCNSGTNFKYKPRSYKKTVARSFGGSLIHFGGCADGESSYGDSSGGVFTTALIDAWDENLNYYEWYTTAFNKMPRNQIPVYAEYGVSVDTFRLTKALK